MQYENATIQNAFQYCIAEEYFFCTGKSVHCVCIHFTTTTDAAYKKLNLCCIGPARCSDGVMEKFSDLPFSSYLLFLLMLCEKIIGGYIIGQLSCNEQIYYHYVWAPASLVANTPCFCRCRQPELLQGLVCLQKK